MKFLYILLILFACNSKVDLNEKWLRAVELRKESDLMSSITLLKEIISLDRLDSLSIKAQYQIADIYLNDVNDYDLAVVEFKKLLNEYSDTEYSKKSLFMLGYISANYIQAYSDAINYYNTFLSKYPADDLSYSVQYEIDALSDIIEDLNSLKDK
tara:strand:- start:1922 stop:2386 length:465 start_codon:yes stop_codon:yes gene_type:complete